MAGMQTSRRTRGSGTATARFGSWTGPLLGLGYRTRQCRRYFLTFESWRRIRAAGHWYGVSPFRIVGRLLALYARERFAPEEVLERGLADPRVPLERHRLHISEARLHPLQARINSPHADICRDKLLFHSHCVAHGLPAPRLLAVLSRYGSRTGTGYPLFTDSQWQRFFTHEMPERAVVKPRYGNKGRAIHVVDRGSCGAHDDNGADALIRNCAAHDEDWLVQERLTAHPAIARLTGSSAISGVRVFTVVQDDGAPAVLDGYFRVISGDTVTDNLSRWDSDARSGNIMASYDLKTGIVLDAWQPGPDGIGLEWVACHPRTGETLVGFGLPFWDALLELVQRAAVTFLPLTTVGWDIAITPHGPVMVEGNERYQHAAYGEQTAALRCALERVHRNRIEQGGATSRATHRQEQR